MKDAGTGQQPGTADPGLPYAVITPDEAVAAIEAAAWTSRPGDETYRNAVEALNLLISERPGPLTPGEARAVIAEHVPDPRRIIHAVAASLGADWDLAGAVAFARKPGAVCWWACDLLGHDLHVRADGRRVAFDVRPPELLRRQLKHSKLRRITERAARAEADSGEDR